MLTRVAVCQVPDIQQDVQASLEWIENFTKEAELKQVSLICFPECFLQGYLTEENPARRFAINLQSPEFNDILDRLARYSPMIVFGMIEEENDLLFNTAVTIQAGSLVGKYRKTHLLDGEAVFHPGNNFPAFDINGLRFGINICYDTQFPEATSRLVEQGVKLILCVSNTMMSAKKGLKFKNLHLPMRAERVKEHTGVWMLSADVTGERNGRIAYGSTSAINPEGNIVEQIPFMETGMLIVEFR